MFVAGEGGGSSALGSMFPFKSALNFQVLCCRFASIRDLFDDLPFIQTTEASLFDCRDVDKNVSSAAPCG